VEFVIYCVNPYTHFVEIRNEIPDYFELHNSHSYVVCDLMNLKERRWQFCEQHDGVQCSRILC
jgi:hypothetical protein